MDQTDVVVQFMASFSAVLLAFGLSYWYDRNEKNKQTVQTKRRILIAIIDEYKAMVDEFAKYKPAPNDQIGMPLTHFANTAVVSAMSSGDLPLLSPSNQVLIDHVNRILNDYQDELERLYLLTLSAHAAEPLGDALFRELKPLLQADGNTLQKLLPEIVLALQRELDSYSGKNNGQK